MARMERTQFAEFVAGLLFIKQQVVIRTRQMVDRATARRAARQQVESRSVDVVTLRRIYPDRASGEHRSIEWSHQWLVRGHWRQQWFPSRNVYEPRYIEPYVKGPADKPLKPPSKQIFAVVR